MKKSYLMGFATSLLLLSGCGSSTNSTASKSLASNSSSTITVERGVVLKAAVIDANGQKAQENGGGKYTFSTKPTYPIIATGGVIDIDKDGKVSVGDVANDVNLTTIAGKVITVVTTLEANPKTKLQLDKIASDLNISSADIITQTPSTSKEIEAISNITYKYIKENNITNMFDVNSQKLSDLNISKDVLSTYHRYANDAEHNSTSEEAKLMQEIKTHNTNNIHILSNDAEVQDEVTKAQNENENIDVEHVKSNLLKLKNEYELAYGDMSYEDSGSDVGHYQGMNCAQCHSAAGTGISKSEGREGSENTFSSGATIFTTLHAQNSDATKAANNYSLRLVLSGSNAIKKYSLGRGTGNVHASFNAGIASYTAEVLDASGNVVNSSLAGSHDASRFDCNRCHTSTGLNSAPGRIVSFKYSIPSLVDLNNTTLPDANTTVADTNTTTLLPVASKSFANDVLPILNNKCAACHGGSGNFSITSSLSTPYAGVTPFVNTTTPASSRLLQKASGTIGHGGGIVIQSTTASYATIRDWIAEGAKNN